MPRIASNRMWRDNVDLLETLISWKHVRSGHHSLETPRQIFKCQSAFVFALSLRLDSTQAGG